MAAGRAEVSCKEEETTARCRDAKPTRWCGQEGECKEERTRLEALSQREEMVEARITGIQEIVREQGNRRVVLDVRGTMFRSDIKSLCGRYPKSVIAATVSDNANKHPEDKCFCDITKKASTL